MTDLANEKHSLPSLKQCYVYILQCSDNTLYTGWTDNLEKRLLIHNSGKGAKYTRGRLPVKIVYTETLPDPSSAKKREAEIKKMSRPQKLKFIETALKPCK